MAELTETKCVLYKSQPNCSKMRKITVKRRGGVLMEKVHCHGYKLWPATWAAGVESSSYLPPGMSECKPIDARTYTVPWSVLYGPKIKKPEPDTEFLKPGAVGTNFGTGTGR